MSRAARIVFLALVVVNVAVLGVVLRSAIGSAASSSNAAASSARSARESRTASNRALEADARSTNASREAQLGLARYKALSAAKRAQNQRNLRSLHAQADANQALTEQIGALANQRAVDNAHAAARAAGLAAANRREVTALAAAESRIAALQASQHHETLQAQYDTCVQVERLKRATRFTLVTIFTPIRLTPAERAEIDRLEAQFNPRVCRKP